MQSRIGFVIVGVSGAEKTIFDADSTNRHFYINIYSNDSGKGYKQKFEGISFINGYEPASGGSIIIGRYADASFDACIFENNQAVYGSGAISSQGKLEINGTTFKNNKALTTAENGSSTGGALYVSNNSNLTSSVVIKNSKFIGNSAQANRSARGGAIYIDVSVDIINTTFIDNYTVSGLNNSSDSYNSYYMDSEGGALYVEAVNYQNYDYVYETVRLINSTFDGNYVDSDFITLPDAISGASIFVMEGKVYMFNSNVTNSHVKYKGEIYNGIYGTSGYYDEDDKVINFQPGW